MSDRQDTLRGIVRAVKIRRLPWGTCEIDGHAVTGTVNGLRDGDSVEARGAWSTHATYGEQFKATSIVRTVPSDESGTIAWLAARLPGIGAATARAIVERFGVDGALHTIAHEPERLCEIRGISKRRAELAAAELREVLSGFEEQRTLLGWGLTESQIKRVHETWGERALERIRENPYALIEHVEGFGFARADAIALRMGLPHGHRSRVEAGILHTLRKLESEGHCYEHRDALRMRTHMLLQCRDGFERALDALAFDGRVEIADGRVALASLHRAESRVAECVRALLKGAA